MLLLQAVNTAKAHVSPHGEKQKRFDTTLSVFAESTSLHRNSGELPIMKTFMARLESLVSKRKSEVRANEAASGIEEYLSEKD